LWCRLYMKRKNGSGRDMMKKMLAFWLLLSQTAISTYSQVDFDRGQSVNIKEMVSSMPSVALSEPRKGFFDFISSNSTDAPVPPKEWTVMVYMNGKNDLESAGFEDIQEMEKVGSSDKINIIVEWGRMNGQRGDTSVDGNWTGSRRYYIFKDRNNSKIKSKIVGRFKNVDMGDWRHLVDFARWAKKKYPAKRYMLVIWNHGTGWKTDKRLPEGKGISYDFDTNNHISTPELQMAMKKIGKVDILAFDACLMQMLEVAYEVREYANYIFASEQVLPASGFPYDYFLEFFSGKSAVLDTETIILMANDSVASYLADMEDKPITLSTLKLSEMDTFVNTFTFWTKALLASDNAKEIKLSAMAAKRYRERSSKDLYNFAERVAAKIPSLASETANMMSAFRRLVIGNEAWESAYREDKNSHGLAIYLPNKGYNLKYEDLAFARDTFWDEFLKKMDSVVVSGNVVAGCVDPGPNAPLQEISDYLDCILGQLSNM